MSITTSESNNKPRRVLVSLLLGVTLSAPALAGGYGGPYGFGANASASDIAKWDIDAMPDGRGLPPGSGDYAAGEKVYATKCAACHGQDLEGVGPTGGAALIGGRGSLASGSPKKTIESYWPYATTVFDYVKRAMPFNAPGSLRDDEVYAVTAYILGRADIVSPGTEMNRSSLAAVRMPNRDGFIADPRPDVFNYD